LHRVVITGAGLVTSLGFGTRKTIEALAGRASGIGAADRLALPGLKSRRAGLVPPFTASDIDRKLDFSGMNRLSAYAASATFLALADAGFRVGRGNADSIGICMGVCNGPPEEDHMNSVFSSDDFVPDIHNFSNITANSTAGWVSNALCLKGVNMTLSPGPHAGLQSLAYAFNALHEGRAKAMAAGAADEIYPQMYSNYDLIGFLHRGTEEELYRLSSAHDKRKIIGEGAATLLVETFDGAADRGAPILAEVLAYGMSMDAETFSEQSMSIDGLQHACDSAFSRCGRGWNDIGCVVWAPQGNRQDEKVLSVLSKGLGKEFSRMPLVTTTFNTGYIESASILVSLCSVLHCFKNGQSLWPQITGVPEFDSRTMETIPEYVLALAGTDLGYNYAVIVRTGGFVSL
jgi:3-oxoacyl-[acyl-carrier-protein] synthase II